MFKYSKQINKDITSEVNFDNWAELLITIIRGVVNDTHQCEFYQEYYPWIVKWLKWKYRKSSRLIISLLYQEKIYLGVGKLGAVSSRLLMDLFYGFTRPMTIGMELARRVVGSIWFTNPPVLTLKRSKGNGFTPAFKIHKSIQENGEYSRKALT